MNKPDFPLISIILPTFNRKAYLGQALNSIEKQTYRVFELIIVDDGSTDDTTDFVSKFNNSAKFKIIYHKFAVNRGAAATRNFGIKQAKGDFIAFLDSDDLWPPQYLASQVCSLESQKDKSFVVCSSIFVYPGRSQFTLTPIIQYNDPILSLLLDNTLIFTMSSLLVRRKAIERAGLLNEKLVIVHDREWCLRLLQFGSVTINGDLFVIKHELPNNLLSNYRIRAKEAFKVIKIFSDSEFGKSYRQYSLRANKNWSRKLMMHVFKHHGKPIFGTWLSLQWLWYSLRAIFAYKGQETGF